jgi:hypothetical protein
MSLLVMPVGTQPYGSPGNFSFTDFAYAGGNLTDTAGTTAVSNDTGYGWDGVSGWIAANPIVGPIAGVDRSGGISITGHGLTQGLIIDYAEVEIEVQSVSSPASFVVLTCEDADAADAPAAGDGPVDSATITWTKTTATAGIISSMFVAGGQLCLPITAPLQELVSRAGWNAGRINFELEMSDLTGTYSVTLSGHDIRPPTMTVSYRQ